MLQSLSALLQLPVLEQVKRGRILWEIGTFGMQGSQERLSYPPEDLGQALGNLFLQGSVSEEAWKLKLAALLYYLLDVGNKSVLTSFGCATDVGGSQPLVLRSWPTISHSQTLSAVQQT